MKYFLSTLLIIVLAVIAQLTIGARLEPWLANQTWLGRWHIVPVRAPVVLTQKETIKSVGDDQYEAAVTKLKPSFARIFFIDQRSGQLFASTSATTWTSSGQYLSFGSVPPVNIGDRVIVQTYDQKTHPGRVTGLSTGGASTSLLSVQTDDNVSQATSAVVSETDLNLGETLILLPENFQLGNSQYLVNKISTLSTTPWAASLRGAVSATSGSVVLLNQDLPATNFWVANLKGELVGYGFAGNREVFTLDAIRDQITSVMKAQPVRWPNFVDIMPEFTVDPAGNLTLSYFRFLDSSLAGNGRPFMVNDQIIGVRPHGATTDFVLPPSFAALRQLSLVSDSGLDYLVKRGAATAIVSLTK